MDLYEGIDELIHGYFNEDPPASLPEKDLEDVLEMVTDHLSMIKVAYDPVEVGFYINSKFREIPRVLVSTEKDHETDSETVMDDVLTERDIQKIEKKQQDDVGLIFVEKKRSPTHGSLFKVPSTAKLPYVDPDYAQKRLDHFRSIPQHPQKSAEWLSQRVDHITASTVADALGLKGNCARRNLLINKISRGEFYGFSGSPATHWGERYEPVADSVYEFRRGCKIHEFGMIPHPEHEFLGVSTDGITDNLTNLEIKCPISREISKNIPKHYWCQVQLQLEVLDLEQSDFLECLFKEITKQEFYDNFYYVDHLKFRHLEKGVQFEVWDPDQQKLLYLNSPLEYHMDHRKMERWESETLSSLIESGLIHINTIYWVLSTYSCTIVKRDRKWFSQALPLLQEFWKTVLDYREIGLDKFLDEHGLTRSGAKIVKKETVLPMGSCLLDD